jgi:double-stranded uracil-DNA glycosylase
MRGADKPTRAEIAATAGKTLTDVIAPDLQVLFCGFNPGLYSGATGHHFARPGNRFWPTLYAAGVTDRLPAPAEERLLLTYGYGLTNFVERATAAASDLETAELRTRAQRLRKKIGEYRPRVPAVLGITAYRSAFARPRATLGPQPERIHSTQVWVLPNPSGLNAHYPPENPPREFRNFRLTIEWEEPE